jgi:hypothetical protein
MLIAFVALAQYTLSAVKNQAKMQESACRAGKTGVLTLSAASRLLFVTFSW